MAFRCEDAPCCGCFTDPRGCVDREIVLTCKKCKSGFHPDAHTVDMCLRCEISTKMEGEDEDGWDGDYEGEDEENEDDGERDYNEDGRNEDCGFFGYAGLTED